MLKKLLLGLLFTLPFSASAVQVTVPSAPSSGYFLISTTTGNYVASSTPSFGTGLYSLGLTSCNTSTSALTWSAGSFGCHTISATSGSGSVATSTNETPGTLAYWTSNSATPALLGKVSTTTLTLSGFPANIPSTLGALVGGSNTTWTWWGLATTSQPASSNLLVSNGGAGVYGVATSTLTVSSPLTGSFVQVGSGGSLGCQTATSLLAGCLSTTDWGNFNNKISSSSLSGASVISYTGSTGVITTTGGTFGSGNYVFPSQLEVDSSTTLQNWTGLSSTSTNATTTASFAGTASSSKLFTANFQGAGLSTCTGAAQSFHWAGGLFSCATLSGFASSTLLGDNNSFSGTNLFTTQATTDNSTRAATTAYVTTAIANAVAGVNPAVAVQAATTAAGDTSSLTYNNGVGGIGAFFTGSVNTAVVVDGYTFNTIGQRLLVKNDTQSPSGAFNGVYYLSTVQGIAAAPVFTRALDYDMPSDINNTGAIPVVSGTVNGTTSWVLTSTVNTVGTDPLTYTQFSINPSTIVTTTRTINTTYPVQGGGTLASDRTISLAFGTTTDNNWSGANIFQNASTTIVGGLTIGGNSTTTNATTTTLAVTSVASTSKLYLGNIGSANAGCVTVSAVGLLTGSGASCGTSTDKWATSTSPNTGIYPNTANYVGIGTTTPGWPLEVASGTTPQLALSDGVGTDPEWVFRNAGGNLYFATSVPSTFATTTQTPFNISSNGFVNIGTSTQPKPLYIFGTTAGGVTTIHRQTSLTTGNIGTIALLSESTGAIGNNPFGTGLNFQVEDSANAPLTLGSIYVQTDRGATNGTLNFAGTFGGVLATLTVMRDSNFGIWGLGTSTPVGTLDIVSGSGSALQQNYPQLVLTDYGAAVDSKHIYASSSAGELSIGSISDSLSTVSSPWYRLSAAGSTTTNATSTNDVSTTASTTNLYIATNTCSGSSALNVVNGKVTCGAVSGVGAASSTLLGDNNNWTGGNAFTGSTTLASFAFVSATGTRATTTSFAILGITSKLLSADANGSVVASTSIGANLLKGAASSILGFDGSGNPVATTSIGSNYIKGPVSSLFAFDSSGNASASTSIGVNYLTGTLPVNKGGTGAATLSGCLTGNGTGAITGSGTCNTSAATLTSIIASTGLSGGTITTSGTIKLLSYLATSTADTSGNIAVWSSSNATPATLSNFTGYSITSALATLANASTTNFTVSNFMNVINGGKMGISSTTPTYQFSINTTGSEFDVRTTGEVVGYDATNAFTGRITPTSSFVLSTGTSTTWTASTTGSGYSPQLVMPFTGTLQQVRCVTDASFVGVNVVVNGSNAAPSYFVASTTIGKETFSSANTFTVGQVVLVNFGTTTTSTTKNVSCTFDATETP